MSALWLVASCWMVVALLLAAVIGRAVRIADEDAALTAELNSVVAGSIAPPSRGAH